MKPPPFRVLVFPSSTEPGFEVLQALAKSNKIELLAGSSFDVDFDPSRGLVEEHLQLPALGDPRFRESFEGVLREHEVDLVFPTVDAVVAEMAGWSDPPCPVAGGPADSARLLLSKRRSYERLKGRVPVPEVYDDEIRLPAYAKPDVGSGSRGGMLVTSKAEVELARERSLLVHEHLPGEEYTVDCASGLDGGLLFAQVRVRSSVARGIAVGTQAVERPELSGHVAAIAEELGLTGPWFAQFKAASDGTAKLLEVNARVSGSMTLTRLSGVNIPLLSVFLFMGYEVAVPRVQPGVRINRLLRTLGEVDDFDWVIWDLDDTLVRKDGKVDPDVVARLHDLHNQGRAQLLLTRNPDPQAVLERLHIPRVFREVRSTEDKVAEVGRALGDLSMDPSRCVMVNDSVIENLAVQEAHPELRTVMPDALDVLRREKVR